LSAAGTSAESFTLPHTRSAPPIFCNKLQPVIAEQDNRPITLLPGLIAKTLPEERAS
jgi:hypothetical protein